MSLQSSIRRNGWLRGLDSAAVAKAMKSPARGRGRRACLAAAVPVEMLELRVLLSDAASIFAPAVRAYNAAYQNVSPDAVDLNGDGRNDMVVTDSSGSAAKVVVLLNNGSGGFGAGTQVWSGTATPTVQEEDLNGDGKPDLIINTSGSAGPTGVVDIVINNGSGVFAAPVHVYTGGNSLSVEPIDLNGDNRPDLIIEDMSNLPGTNSKVVVTLNSGTGSFGTGTQIWTDTKVATVQTAELTHDNRPDIVLTQSGSFYPSASNAVVKVLLNNGSGGFSAAATVYTGGQFMAVAQPVDLTGDNAADLVISDFGMTGGTVIVMLNHGNGTFAAATEVWTGDTMAFAYAWNLNADTRPDLVITQQGDGDTVFPMVEVLLNNGSGVFGAATTVYTAADATTSVMPTPVDLNGDTRPELIIQTWSDAGSKVVTLLNNGSGVFGAPVQVWTGTQTPMVQPVDVTGDSRPDLIISQMGADPGGTCSIDVLKNNGTGTFGAPTRVYNGSHPTIMTIPLDLDGDDKIDLLVEDYDDTTPAGLLMVVLNTGSGNFGTPGQAWSGTVMPDILPVDLTGDDLPDLVLSLDGQTIAQTGTVDVRLNTSAPTPPTNQAPTNIALTSTSVAEGQPSGTTVGTLSATDPDAANTFSYTLVAGTGSADNGSFTIVGAELKTAASFVYATKSSYSIRIRVTDQGGLSYDKTFTISVTAVAPTNHAPTDIALTSTSVAEGQPSGTPVGTLSATDPDAANTFSYALVTGTGSADNGSFTIAGNTLKTAASFVYATKSSYSIRIRVTDQGGLSYDKSFTVNVTQVAPTNHAPTDIGLTSASVAEGQPTGTTVGTLSATDSDTGSTFSYALVAGTGSADNGSFTIAGNELKTGASFVYATKNSYSIRVRVTDQGGLSYDKSFTINVTEVAPVTYTFGTVGGKIVKPAPFVDSDGDLVTLSLTGGGTGTIDDDHLIVLAGTTAKSALTIKVKKVTAGNGLFSVSGISIAGLLKTISAAPVALNGDLLVNTGNATPATTDKLAVTLGALTNSSIISNRLPIASLKILDWQDTDAQADELTAPSIGSITVSGRKANPKTPAIGSLPGDLDASITTSGSIGAIKAAGAITGTIRAGKDAKGSGIASITATGGMQGATVIANGSIGKISMTVLFDSDILVGVASNFAGQFAGHDDFTNPAAKLGSLKVTGRKLTAGQNHPAYVVNSHISAANVGTLGLLNVPADAGQIVHVLNDVGTLQVSQTKLVAASMFPSVTSKTPTTRPTLWQVV